MSRASLRPTARSRDRLRGLLVGLSAVDRCGSASDFSDPSATTVASEVSFNTSGSRSGRGIPIERTAMLLSQYSPGFQNFNSCQPTPATLKRSSARGPSLPSTGAETTGHQGCHAALAFLPLPGGRDRRRIFSAEHFGVRQPGELRRLRERRGHFPPRRQPRRPADGSARPTAARSGQPECTAKYCDAIIGELWDDRNCRRRTGASRSAPGYPPEGAGDNRPKRQQRGRRRQLYAGSPARPTPAKFCGAAGAFGGAESRRNAAPIFCELAPVGACAGEPKRTQAPTSHHSGSCADCQTTCGFATTRTAASTAAASSRRARPPATRSAASLLSPRGRDDGPVVAGNLGRRAPHASERQLTVQKVPSPSHCSVRVISSRLQAPAIQLSPARGGGRLKVPARRPWGMGGWADAGGGGLTAGDGGAFPITRQTLRHASQARRARSQRYSRSQAAILRGNRSRWRQATCRRWSARAAGAIKLSAINVSAFDPRRRAAGERPGGPRRPAHRGRRARRRCRRARTCSGAMHQSSRVASDTLVSEELALQRETLDFGDARVGVRMRSH
jgi:hypothetical protein